MNQDRLNREWIDLAPAWIHEAREGVNPTRTGLLDKPMLQACGNVAGLRILDCGCGEGRFCRMLARQGAAYVLGLDLCEPMIDAANELRGERDEYRVADVQETFLCDLGCTQEGCETSDVKKDRNSEKTIISQSRKDRQEVRE